MLEVENLFAGYGHGNVLDGISFSVREGEVVSLLGRNGAGESTTLKAIQQMIRPSAGRVVFKGRDVVGRKVHEVARAGIGYVPEERRVFPKLTIEDNLRITRLCDGASGIWTLDRVYESFPILAERRNQFAATMSGGEQQMLAIARTLIGNPSLLLLDEPSEGLAPMVVQQLAEQINEMKRSGLTILLSEQNLGFAEKLSDRVYVIDKGVIKYHGDFATLREDADLRAAFLTMPSTLAASRKGRSAPDAA